MKWDGRLWDGRLWDGRWYGRLWDGRLWDGRLWDEMVDETDEMVDIIFLIVLSSIYEISWRVDGW